MRKLRVIFMFIACMILFSSCSENEITDTVYVSAMSIVEKNDIYNLTLYGKDFEVNSSGRTIAEALNNAKENSGNNLFLGTLESISANGEAMRDSALLSAFTNSAAAPSCKVYFTESPVIPKNGAGGYERKLSELSVSLKSGTPVVIPLADNPEKICVLTNSETIVLNEEDSFGVMLLRGEAPEKVITILSGEDFKTFKISPKTKKSAEFTDGKIKVTAEISLRVDNFGDEDLSECISKLEDICTSVYKKLANQMGTDVFGISDIIGFTQRELCESEIFVSVKGC